MRSLAGGSVFLGAVALFSTLFYFQPTVEAVTLVNNNSPNNLLQQFNNQDIRDIQNTPKTEQTQVQTSKEKSENSSVNVSNAISFNATAYCLKGRTASGGSVRRGIVAADPRVLPLGSRIVINAGAYSGTYTVADTGGGVRGRKLDIWVPSCSEANRFGRRNVTVSKLGRKS